MEICFVWAIVWLKVNFNIKYEFYSSRRTKWWVTWYIFEQFLDFTRSARRPFLNRPFWPIKPQMIKFHLVVSCAQRCPKVKTNTKKTTILSAHGIIGQILDYTMGSMPGVTGTACLYAQSCHDQIILMQTLPDLDKNPLSMGVRSTEIVKYPIDGSIQDL